MKGFYSAHGKLLLSGEYFVLDGAIGLALPANYGQHLAVSEHPETPNHIHWKSYASSGAAWFEAIFAFPDCRTLQSSHPAVSHTLEQILQVLHRRSPQFRDAVEKGLRVRTYLDFPENWGLGSSSTLLSCLAQWTGLNPFELLEATMGGSGYDIACAHADGPLLYQKPSHISVPFSPAFHRHLYFVHLGHKQNSREGIALYRKKGKAPQHLVDEISRISLGLSVASTQKTFDTLLEQHETLVADYLGLAKAKALYFSDFEGSIKSLGAWGGDFVLASSRLTPEETRNYFHQKGYHTLLPWADLCR